MPKRAKSTFTTPQIRFKEQAPTKERPRKHHRLQQLIQRPGCTPKWEWVETVPEDAEDETVNVYPD